MIYILNKYTFFLKCDFDNIFISVQDFGIGMSEETKTLITQKRYEALRGVLKTLKQHPHKAGIKIRFLKDNIDNFTE